MKETPIRKDSNADPDSWPAPVRLRAAQIRQIYSQSSLGSLAATLGGMVFAAALYTADPDPWIIVWIVLYSLTFVAHHLLVRAFAKLQPTGDALFKWGRYHWIVVATGSLAWTYAVLFLFPSTFLHLQLFMIIFVGGIVSGAAVIYAPTREFLVSNAVILVPLAAHFIILGDRYNVTVGLLLFGFGIVMFVMGANVHRLYSELLRIRFEREDLIRGLVHEVSVRQEAEDSLRQARDSLEVRVAERTAELQTINLDLAEEISERRKAEEAIRKSEEKYRLLFDNAQESIIITQEGRLKFWNSATEDLLGFSSEQLADAALCEMVHQDDRERVSDLELLRVHDPSQRDVRSFRLLSSDGKTMWVQSNSVAVEWEGAPATLNFLTNVTELKKAEDLHVRMEKLRAIGDLASGVAHNFNNVLQVVMAGTELALSQLDKGEIKTLRKDLERIRESSKLGSATVKRLQRFAKIRRKHGTSERRVVDLAEIVQQSIEITRPLWETNPERKGIRIDMHLDLAHGCFVAAAENELVEVVINLIKNAAEAMPLGGSIRIATTIGNQAELQVADTGIGIPEDFLEHLFEPYWSTKGAEGTGMGLAVTRQILNDHGGIISVTSQLGQGAVFKINLPLAEIPKRTETSSVCLTPDLGLKILVIDDTEPLVFFLKELLARQGNDVLCATSGSEGLDLFRENDVDLVICDLGMPNMTGWEVGRTIASICEERGIAKTPFMLLTGWGGNHWTPL